MPRLLANKKLPIPRYWLPFQSASRLEASHAIRLHDGILPDPEDDFEKTLNPTLTTLESIEAKRCFALLGQPGLGKSIAVEQWVDSFSAKAHSNDAVILLRSRELGSPEEIRRLSIDCQRWRTARDRKGEVTLILDGLDEALQRLPVITHTLRKYLEEEPLDQTRIVLVSRIADWQESRTEDLFALWPETERGGVFELCPLRWKDVRLAAKTSGISPDALSTALLDLRVAWMAGRPKLLLMLIEEFKSNRRLPYSRYELYSRAAARMAKEHDAERNEILERSARPVVPHEEIYAVVSRIAALMLLSGKSHICTSETTDTTSSGLHLEEIIGGVEPFGEKTCEVDRTHLLAAINSSHFVSAGSGRLTFDHQSMADFMAAEYLHRLTVPQLRGLFTQRIESTDYILPQFRETIGWIASRNSDFRSFLLSKEPHFLVEADAAETAEPQRRQALLAILDQMDSETSFEDTVSDFFIRSLNRKQLSKQLRPFIIEEQRNWVVRRTAIRFAGIARCRELKEDLWNLLKSGERGVYHAAVNALGAMATRSDAQRFSRVLSDDLSWDVDQEFRGEALKILTPRLLPVRAALKFLVPRSEDFFGNYWNALNYHLPANIRLHDIIPILKESRHRADSGDYSGVLQKLVEAALRLGLQHFNNRGIRRACIRFLATQSEQEGWRGTWEQVCPAKLSECKLSQLRRLIMEGFVDLAKGKFAKFARFHLWPEPSDLGWLLERVRVSSGASRTVWINLASHVLRQEVPKEFEWDILQTYRIVPAFRKMLPCPRRFDLLVTLQRQVKARKCWLIVWERRQQRRKAKQQENKLSIEKILDGFREGHVNWWPHFPKVLRKAEILEEIRHIQPSRDYNIGTWDSWRALPESSRRLARRMAWTFLCEAPVPKRELGSIFVYDTAAVRAITLLQKSKENNSEFRIVVLEKWIPAILHGIFNEEPSLIAANNFAYQLDRRQCLKWASKDLVFNDAKDAGHSSLRRFKGCWDESLTRVVANFAKSTRNSHTLFRMFALLSDVAPRDAEKLWLRQLKNHTKPFDKRKRTLVFLGLFAFPRRGWISSFSQLKRSKIRIQIRLFAENAWMLNYDFRNWSSLLTDQQLADLYLLLVTIFPAEKLNDYSRGGSPRTRDHIGDMQRACLNGLVQRGNESSCKELNRIAKTVPSDSRLEIRWHLRQAIDLRLRTEWIADRPSPKEILRMSRVANALRVRDAEELQEAVLASLSRLQAAMHVGNYPRVLNFWRDPDQLPKTEREACRSLAEWFETDLLRDGRIIANREPQVGWKGNLDIKFEVPSKTKGQPPITVVLEAKLCSHAKVKSACETQLAEGYLRRKQLTHGIYLVIWHGADDSKMAWTSPEEAQSAVASWAKNASIAPIQIRGLVLDCRWVGMEAPSAL